MRSADTSAEAHAVQVAIYREMAPDRRVSIAVEMCDEVFRQVWPDAPLVTP